MDLWTIYVFYQPMGEDFKHGLIHLPEVIAMLHKIYK